MNSGICIKGSSYNDYERDYYGMLIDIVEFEYFGRENNVVLFKCEWYDTERGTKIDPRYGLVDVNFKSRLAVNEAFILAQQATQVYYTIYPSCNKDKSSWWAVCKAKLKIINDDRTIIEDGNMSAINDALQEDDGTYSIPILSMPDFDDITMLRRNDPSKELEKAELQYIAESNQKRASLMDFIEEESIDAQNIEKESKSSYDNGTSIHETEDDNDEN
ncbi:hypothetical protein AXF42_Ash011585 [Apostasia shenzhenica]|uniref:DUF4216 domain-containing protein n=1 Tax=Apostasia shenzhenica TaxID=1088818 RepID=A0A2I0BB12_9ASPA|nr:hypothetical protein AXF42_Ash011585 [Apostasia shenzhenica]